MNSESKDIHGSVKIGNGKKLHKAMIDKTYGLVIRCGCSGTQQGSAYHRARFFSGIEPNCKN